MLGKNNVGSIKFSPLCSFAGVRGKTNGYYDFANLGYGVRALAKLFFVEYVRIFGAVSPREILFHYYQYDKEFFSCYLLDVCNMAGVSPFERVSKSARAPFLRAVIIAENGMSWFARDCGDIDFIRFINEQFKYLGI